MKVLPCYEQSTTRDQCWPDNCKITRLPAVKYHIVADTARKFRAYCLKMSRQCWWHVWGIETLCFFSGGTAGCRYLWSIHSQNDGFRGWTGGLWPSVTYFSLLFVKCNVNTILEKRCQALSLLPQQLLLGGHCVLQHCELILFFMHRCTRVAPAGLLWWALQVLNFIYSVSKTYFWEMCACMCLSMWMTTWQSCLLASCWAALMMLLSGEAQRRTVHIDKCVLCFNSLSHTRSGCRIFLLM